MISRRNIIDLTVLAGATALVAWLLPWRLIFSTSTPTGGDSVTQYWSFIFLRDQVLPHWRLWAWNPGNLAGYPFFQFYFPLPFLLMSLLGQALDPEVAFKVVALLPALAMPLCAYVCARQLGLEFPGPAVAAALVLTFLLREEGYIWGGSLNSLLIGVFGQSYGICLALLYLGLLPRWVDRARGLLPCGLLLWFIGLSHPYAMLFCLVAGLYFPLRSRHWTLAGRRLFILYTLAFLLWAHWLIPMLAYSPYTEKFNFIWAVDSWRQFFPPTMLPVIALGLLGLGLSLFRAAPDERRRAGFLAFWIFATALLYLVSPLMNTITVRFLPFAYLALVLLAAQGLARLARNLAAQGAFALLILAAGVLWAGLGLEQTPRWLDWNNSGWQSKPMWSDFQPMAQFLKGDYAQPRVSYEHSMLYQGLGSVRALETLPLFTGRATLEVSYLQASPSAPFIFYLQSETTQRSSTPLPGYAFARFNLPRAIEHLRLFNVGQYVAVEEATKKVADHQKGLFLQRRFGPFSVYGVSGNSDRYAVAPRFWPVLVQTRRPQRLAYLWFRFCDLKVPLVFVEQASMADRQRFPSFRVDSGREDDPLLEELRHDRLPHLPVRAQDPGGESIANERLDFNGLSKWRPLLIKMSYHPAWRSLGGEKIYRATPAFMLIFPEREQASLVFGWAWPHVLGVVLTGLGLLWMFLYPLRPAITRRLVAADWQPPTEQERGRSPWWWIILWLLGLGLLAGLLRWHDDANTLLTRGRELAQAGRLQQAEEVLREGLRRFPSGVASDYTIYELAMLQHRRQRYPQALELLERLRRDFPDSVLLPENLYFLALCQQGAGRPDLARAEARELLAQFPDSTWAQRAQEEGLAGPDPEPATAAPAAPAATGHAEDHGP